MGGLHALPAGLLQRLPYCGSPPFPENLAGRWNVDPVLLASLAAVLLVYGWGALTGRVKGPTWRAVSFVTGWAIAALALTSPLCALSVSLFSARVGQHLILMFMAAPLVVMGCFSGEVDRDDPIAAAGRRWISPVSAAAAFAVAMWFWHAPGPYLATFQSSLVYWTMHLTLFASAVWLWWALLADPHRTPAGTVGVVAITAAQMGLLSALITFASHPFYAPHLLTTAAWGMTPLDDQQFGGALMWLPAGAILVGALTLAFLRVLLRPGAARPPQPST